ncbi:MAG: hypothetical protein LKF96_06610 [Treponema sp.]|nr:hypothetical protein [Treponema sp.]
MKKLLIAALIANAAFAFAYDTSPFLKPSGAVKSYTKTDYTITQKFGDFFRTPGALYKHTFDTSGREIASEEFNPQNEPVDKVTYEYDEKGNLAAQTAYDADATVEWKIISTRDANGNKTDDSEYNKNGTLKGKSIYKYLDDGSVDESYYNGDGALIWKNISSFDKAGRKTEENRYAADGSLDEKLEYTYDDTGRVSEILHSGVDAAQTEREVYLYDKAGLLTELALYNENNEKTQRKFYKYDDKGNVIKTTTYAVSKKFGSIVNELTGMSEYTYE